MIGSKEIGLQLGVFFPFLWLDFSFATLKASGKTLWDTDKSQMPDIGHHKTSAPSHKKHSDSMSMPAALVILIL